MPKKLGLITLHGMGDQPVDYFKKLTERLSKRLAQQLWNQIAFKSVYYQGTIQENQQLMRERMKVGRDLDFTWIRKRMLFSITFMMLKMIRVFLKTLQPMK